MQNSNHLCVYCGQPAKYQFKNGKWCCSKHNFSCPAIKKQISTKIKIMWNDLKSQDLSTLKDKKTKKENIIPNICAYCGKQAKYQLKNGKWCCSKSPNSCPQNKRKNSEKIKSLYSHSNNCILFNGKEKICSQKSRLKQGWNRGLTKYTDSRIKNRGEKLSQRYKKGELIPSFLGKKHTDKTKDKIVFGMTHFRVNKNLKGFKKGWYKGYWCDSSWQLAFIMYNIDHNIKFERNKNGFNYQYNNKIKKFYPDFIIDNQYIEIKGYYNNVVAAKIKYFPKQLKLKILYKKDIEPYIKYAIDNYGQTYWNLLTNKN